MRIDDQTLRYYHSATTTGQQTARQRSTVTAEERLQLLNGNSVRTRLPVRGEISAPGERGLLVPPSTSRYSVLA